MKSERKETLLQQKMNELEPLAGGIVFGKEEAWDKLQARLEQKPARKINLRYGVAAAILLLVASVMLFRIQPSQKATTVHQPPQPVYKNSLPGAPKENMEQPRHFETTATHRQSVTHKPEREIVATAAPTEQPITAGPANTVSKDTFAKPAVAVLPSAKKAMSVVSIYDLERSGDLHRTRTINDSSSPSADLQTMKVVFIQDVEKQDIGVRRIRRENRFTQVHPIFGHAIDEFDQAPEEPQPQPNLLKNMFHPQN